MMIALLAVWWVLGAATARADAPMFHVNKGAAINGFDVVAYFVQGEPVPGNPDVAVMWKGAVWRFSTRQNREAFEANPRAYAPQFGGYCAFAMSQGYLASTDPQAWRIYKGKLYLIHNRQIQEKWAQDIEGHLALAKSSWPDILYAK